MANWVSSLSSISSHSSYWVMFLIGPRPPPPELIFLIVVTASSVLLLLLLLLLRRKNRRMGSPPSSSGGEKQGNRHYNLPPGDQGFLPVVGETFRMISAYKSEKPDSFIDERVAKYGRLFTSHVFGEKTVFSADPEVNRHVLQNEGKLFESSYPSSLSHLLGKYSLVLAKGTYHKQMYSITLSSFSNQLVLRDHLLPDIDRLVWLNTVESWHDGQVVVLLDQAKKITFELAMKQLMSCEPGEWTENLRKEYVQVINGFFSIPFPFKLPFTTYGKAIRARTKVSDQIRQVVRERLRSFSNTSTTGGYGKGEEGKGGGTGFRDFLEILLEKGVREEDEVVDIMLSLLIAAYETTPTAMTLAVKLLTEYPAVLALVRDEHEKIKSRRKAAVKDSDEDVVVGRPFDWNDYKNSMPFTNSVINETLRLFNIVSGVFRRSTEDVIIKGYNIPKGSRVFASFRAVHMDEDYFEDARTFNPWRWQKKEKKQQQQRQQEEQVHQQESSKPPSKSKSKSEGTVNPLCVFGGGPRLCPGYELARVELCVFLHHLVTSFSWDAAEEDKVIFFPTTRTVKGYPIRVRRRH